MCRSDYTRDNIPVGKLHALTTVSGKHYRIIESNAQFPEDSWYHGKKVAGEYAVFIDLGGILQQVSNWYSRYGNAVRKMVALAKEA